MNGMRKILIPGLLLVCFALAAAPASGEVIFSQSFDEPSLADAGAVVDGGGFDTEGPGWRSSSVGDLLEKADSIEVPISGGLPAEGILEFSLRPDLTAGSSDRQSPYETVFEFDDAQGNSLFVVHVRWYRHLHGQTRSLLHFAGIAYSRDLGSRPLGTVAYFDRSFKQGENVVFRIAYGPDPAANAVSANGVPAADYQLMNERLQEKDRTGDLGDLFSRARILRVGVEKSNEDQAYYSPLAFSTIRSLTIRDRDLVRSVEHDGFRVAGYSGRLVAGDRLTVTLDAEPGGVATFDLGTIRDHEMTEVTPGVYEGVHVIAYGEDVEDGLVTGRFTSSSGFTAKPVTAARTIDIDTRVYLDVQPSNDLVPADEDSRAGITVTAADANGREIRDHEVKITLSTTGEYTGTVGGGSFEDLVGGEIEVDWGGVTDSFGEVTAQYVSGFAAKTTIISAKDMTSGDVGVGWIRSFIDGTVDVVVKKAAATALALAGSMEVSLSRDWLTADGKSRSRITAVVKDADGDPVSGHTVQFILYGDNGKVRAVQGRTDSRGRALADYIAGTVMGQVQIEVRDMTSGLSQVVSVELHPDAPAEIILAAAPGEIAVGETAAITAAVSDANGNPNNDVDVLYDLVRGAGVLGADKVATDENGQAVVTFTGSEPGVVTIKGTVISRAPTPAEVSAAEGAVFLYGLAEDPGELAVIEWLVEAGAEVTEGQALVVLEDRDDVRYTVVAPRDGIVSPFAAEERDRVGYGDTLGYVIEVD